MPDPFANTSRTFRELGSLSREQLGQFLPFLQQQQMGFASPLLAALSRAGMLQGNQLAQNLQGSIGALGAGSSGVGAVASGLGSSLGANFALQSRIGLLQQILQGSLQGSLGLVGQLGSLAGQDILQRSAQPGGLERFGTLLAGLGGAAGSILQGR